MDSVRNILPSVYRDPGEPGRDFDLVCSYWDAAVGRRVSQHARPVYYARRRVTIEVDSADWLAQLESMAPLLRRKLNQEMGVDLVDFLLFRTAGPAAARRFGPGRAPESTARASGDVRNPIRRLLYDESKKASGQ